MINGTHVLVLGAILVGPIRFDGEKSSFQEVVCVDVNYNRQVSTIWDVSLWFQYTNVSVIYIHVLCM